jgi:hypothetical protein
MKERIVLSLDRWPLGIWRVFGDAGEVNQIVRRSIKIHKARPIQPVGSLHMEGTNPSSVFLSNNSKDIKSMLTMVPPLSKTPNAPEIPTTTPNAKLPIYIPY